MLNTGIHHEIQFLPQVLMCVVFLQVCVGVREHLVCLPSAVSRRVSVHPLASCVDCFFTASHLISANILLGRGLNILVLGSYDGDGDKDALCGVQLVSRFLTSVFVAFIYITPS